MMEVEDDKGIGFSFVDKYDWLPGVKIAVIVLAKMCMIHTAQHIHGRPRMRNPIPKMNAGPALLEKVSIRSASDLSIVPA